MTKSKAARIKVTLKKYLIMKLRLLFLKRKIFYGTYLENEMALRKFKDVEEVFIVKVLKDKAPLTKFDYRLRTTEARKIKKLTVMYVHNNSITRMLGWGPTIDHDILS